MFVKGRPPSWLLGFGLGLILIGVALVFTDSLISSTRMALPTRLVVSLGNIAGVLCIAVDAFRQRRESARASGSTAADRRKP